MNRENLLELIQKRNFKNIKLQLELLHANDVAKLLVELDDDSKIIIFRLLSKDFSAEVFSYLENEEQLSLFNAFSDEEISNIIDELYTDDFVDLVEELPANAVARILKLASPDDRALVNKYLKYKDDTAGSIMTSEFTKLKKDMSVSEAIAYIRKYGRDSESIYTCFVTNSSRELEGVLNVKDLLLADDNQIVKDIMDVSVINVNTDEDQEHIVKIFQDYDFITLPVVDHENRLVGIITIDDIIDIAREEDTEDFEIMAGISPSEKPYLKTSAFDLSKHRFMWLLFLMISGMINGAILTKYESAFVAMPLLVSFIPMLTDTGGNAGSQSSTLVIRGMALSEINIKDIFKVVFKEFKVSIFVGLGLGIVNFIRIYLTYNHNIAIAFTVSFALISIVLIAKLCGATLPLLAKSLKLDPAIMAAPIITTIVDALGFIIYFNIAEIIFKL